MTAHASPGVSETTLRGQRLMDTGLAARVGARLSELGPGLERLVTDYAFGDVLSRPGFDIKTREMPTVSALNAMGNAPEQLELHMRGALNVGVSRRAELLEIIIQMAVYAGVPACMNGVTAYRAALAARQPKLKLNPHPEAFASLIVKRDTT